MIVEVGYAIGSLYGKAMHEETSTYGAPVNYALPIFASQKD